MPFNADVESVESLTEFRVSLCKFVDAARSALGEAEADLQRHANWLSEDRRRYWRIELTRRTEKARQAKLALLEKKLRKTAGGGRLSCVDEEKALAAAVRRLEEAETKHANTLRWIRQLDEEVFQYKGLIQALNHALDVDFVKMTTLLDGLLDALDRYLALAPPSEMDRAVIGSEALPPLEPQPPAAGPPPTAADGSADEPPRHGTAEEEPR